MIATSTISALTFHSYVLVTLHLMPVIRDKLICVLTVNQPALTTTFQRTLP